MSEVLNVNIAGAAMRLPREAGPALAIGQPVTLTFTGAHLPDPLQVHAKVVACSFQHGRCGVEFVGSEGLHKRLSPKAYSLFNRRAAYRVKLSPAELAVVAIKLLKVDWIPSSRPSAQGPPPANEYVGQLKDISATGIAIWVDLKVSAILKFSQLLEISFGLPPSSEPLLRLTCWVRHSQAQGELVCYGLEFDRVRSKHFQRQQDKIAEYVMRRQREEL